MVKRNTRIGFWTAAAIVLTAAAATGVAVWRMRQEAAPSLPPEESMLREAVTQRPDNPEAVLALANYCEAAGRKPDVVVTLRDGMRYRTKEPAYLRKFAEFYTAWARETESQAKLEAAEQYWRLLNEVAPLGADDWRTLGGIYMERQQIRQALGAYRAALKEQPEDAFTKACVGNALLRLNRYEAGLVYLEEAYDELPEDVDVLRWLAKGHRMLSRHDDALCLLRGALERAPENLRKDIEETLSFQEKLASTLPNWANCAAHAHMGFLLSSSGRPDRAVVEYERALHLFRAGGEADCTSCAMCFLDEVARAYSLVNELDKADDCLEEEIPLCEAGGDYDQLAAVYRRLGNHCRTRADEDSSRAREYLEKALVLHEAQEKYAILSDCAYMKRYALADILNTKIKLHGWSDPAVQEARPVLWREIGSSPDPFDDVVRSLIQIEFRLRYSQRDYLGAMKFVEFLKPVLEPSPERYRQWQAVYAHSWTAMVQSALRDHDGAIEHLDTALTIIEGFRKTVSVDEFRQEFESDWLRDLGGQLIASNISRGNAPSAFNQMERVKGRVLLDLLYSRPLVAPSAHDEMTMPMMLSKAEDEHSAWSPDAGAEEEVLRTIEIEAAPYESIEENLDGLPRAFPTVAEAHPVSWTDALAFVDSFTVLNYFIREHSVYAVVLSPGAVDGVLLPDLTEKKLRALIERFREEMGVKDAIPRDLRIEPRVNAAKETRPTGTAAQELYELLVKPVRPYLKTPLLYISPDDVLNYLAFEALTDENGRCLIDDYAVAYTPSTSVLKYCMDQERFARNTLLALGNPNLKNPAFRLFNAEEEVKTLPALFPQSLALLGEDATESAAVEKASGYDVLHFACHAELNLDDPLLSCLRLTPDDGNDGYLHAAEIFGMRLPASLVVLSACNSGLGEVRKGNEVQGLTRAFFAAGAPAIVASLWTVDDRSTAHLMERFYRNLGSMNKAEALRQAKIETRNEFPDAFHWAAFCLHGDYR